MRTRLLAGAALAFAVLVAAVLVLLLSTQDQATTSPSTTSYPVAPTSTVPTSTNDCLGKGLCLANTLIELAKTDPAAALARYDSAAAQDEQLRIDCHAAYHVIGRVVGKSTKEPWVAFKSGSTNCNYGYVHGVVEGLLDTVTDPETAADELVKLCLPPEGTTGKDTAAIEGNCEHGAGHALLRLVKDAPLALQDCRSAFAEPKFAPTAAATCADGVFMEYANAPATYGSIDGGTDLCDKVAQDFKKTCWMNMGAIWLQSSTGAQDILKAFTNCEQATGYVEECATAIGSVGTFQVLAQSASTQEVMNLCTKVSPITELGCWKGVARGLTSASAQGAADEAEVNSLIASMVPAKYQSEVAETIEFAKLGLPSSQD